ncbi:MAG: amino acid adenylation domain-containing protein [Burkholderiales bacterium]|nr:amino acid adenylation domain-containing protein [Burkholderiales bacterium]
MSEVSTSLTPLGDWLRQATRRFPQAAALETPSATLSYQALSEAVNQQASTLRTAGLHAGDRLGIAATRSADTVIAILAALEVGVAYVPLDLSYPAERLSAMLADAQLRAVVGDPQAMATLRELVGGDVPTLDRVAPVAASPYAASDDLAYVLFTSGSTGRPKGVAMGAQPLRHLIQWHAEHPRLGRAARTLQFAPLSFDVHFQEIVSTLACGGTLVLIPDSHRRDPIMLRQALVEHRVDRLFLPYVALQMLAQADEEAHADGQASLTLLDVVSAGEQLQLTPSIRALFDRQPRAVLHNHYGPTESHVVTAFELSGPTAAWPGIPPIGTALPHVQVALRDPDTQALSPGETGELLLGGACLAHGYLGQAALSAERFLDAPAGLVGRWYATGDLVRRDPCGLMTYLGRIDQQLKVDGFRIEPGDIELALMAHPHIQDAAVTAPDVPGSGRQLVAHVVLRADSPPWSDLLGELRQWLRERLPDYMIPVRFIVLDMLPTTPSGKIDRRNLPLPVTPESTAPAPGQAPLPVAEQLRALWQELLGINELSDDTNVFDAGARSLLVMRCVSRLKQLGLNLSVADIYDHPTIAGMAQSLQGAAAQRKNKRRNTTEASASTAQDGIAIIGMSIRAGNAHDIDTFWDNLLADRESIRRFAPHELDPSVPESLRSRPNFVAARGVMDDADRFDAAFFGISAREATVLDPQQRLFLELCWSALEDAAIDPVRVSDGSDDDRDTRIGVYAGSANNTYLPAMRAEQPELIQQYGEFATMLASEKDYIATRAANRLNLRGPAVSIHTACSTSLVAITQAWHALAQGQCDVALAGGVTVVVPQAGGYLHVEGGMESADGRCRPFDADASGTLFASGGGVVVLKRLQQALDDGDTVYGVIKGVGLNNDGGEKASFTAPSVTGQADVIRMALDHAGVNARSIGYVEAHGTGTSLGDPIEIAALSRAWAGDTTDTQFCQIGSVKGHLGHMVAAAGVVGLIKATLTLHREVIPGTLHYRHPNPHIDFANTPFEVVGSARAWPRGATVRRAAVSSFGVGGTNAHVVLEEAPVQPFPTEAVADAGRLMLLPLSARTPQAALQRAQDLSAYLERHPSTPMASVVATLTRGRQAMPHRIAVVAHDAASAVVALRDVKSATAIASSTPRVVFLFPGQGSQHPGMARQLVDQIPAFREAFDQCLAVAPPALAADLRSWLVEADPSDAAVAAKLAETRHAQPALFSVSYALAVWLDSLGIRAQAMIGHSIGEYAAACHAGVMSVGDAMSAVIARGQAMFEQPSGAMLAVRTSSEVVASLLPAGLEIAAANAPSLTVVAGPHEAISAFATQLEAQDIGTTRLKVSHAFHSASMDGAMSKVSKALGRAALSAPSIPVYSCVSGAPLRAEDATDPAYWARQVRATVQFSRAVQAELTRGETVFVEVGPSQALTALLRQHRTAQNTVPRIVSLLGPAQEPGAPATRALQGLGALWCAGVAIAWPVSSRARRLPLPAYPFRGDVHWFKRRALVVASEPAVESAPLPAIAPFVLPAAEDLPPMSRLPRLEQELTRILGDVSGLPAESVDRNATFVDQGLDSLSLTQATLELERVFGIKLRFRRLLEDLDTLAKLAMFLDAEVPANQFAPPAPAPAAVATPQVAQAMPTALPVHGDAVHQLIQQQMQLMAQQLALLSGQPALVAQTPHQPRPPAPSEPEAPLKTSLLEKPFGASARITLDTKTDFTPTQRRWLDDFIARYNARTGQSKAFSQQHRKVMADPRVVTGFNPLWKDLVYPIVADRSKGAHVWDIDGNEYIDLLSCFGANLLGYQPDSVIQAMKDQLDAGIEVGPQHPIAAEVAQLISELTGMERVAFCNTGSEAVMGAMRIARTVTGRKTIAIFTNSYHGIFDEVIVRGTKQLRSLSAAPGILANAVENILVLDYDSEDSLRVLRERGHELAAIMIEPIQNKYPTLQPREFVKSLRQIADHADCALIFDEVVTGFRLAPGGAQEFYGVRSDLSTYGKIIGGGLPFAAIAGGSKWLDALDGGHWQYGDASYPEAGVTYFAGTFVRHPLALAAARASLLHIKQGGQQLYRTLNERTQRLVDRLNEAFAVRGAPVQAVHCASLWRLSWDDNQKYVSLFYYLARFHGLHLYEQFGHFVTEAMGDAETARILDVFLKALDELMGLGLITPREGFPPPAGPSGGPNGNDAAPLTPGQTERWLAASFDANARRALNESFCLSLSGPVNADALKTAVQDVLERHDAFRVRFDLDQPRQVLGASGPMAIAEVDLRNQPDAHAALDAFCTQASQRDFPLDQAPLAAVSLLRLADGRVVVHVVASHLVFDGWASSVFNAELAQAYKARSMGMRPSFKPAESPLAFAEEEQARFEGPEGQESLRHWQQLLRHPPAHLNLGDRTPPVPRTYAADTQRVRLDGELLSRLRAHARQSGATLFQLLLSAVTVMLQKRSGQPEFIVSIPYASQALKHHGPLMADGVLDLPLRLGCEPQESFATVLKRVRSQLMDALEQPLMTQSTVARALGIRSAGDRPPLTGIYFNLNPKVDLSAYAPLVATLHEGRKGGTLSELFFNFYEQDDALTLDLHYSSEYFSPECAQALINALVAQCDSMAEPLPSTPKSPALAKTIPAADPRVIAWNAATGTPIEPGARIEQWISRQAAATPDAIAVVAQGRTLSYAALEARANRFANLLKSRGIGPGMLVGVSLTRGLDLIPSLLGILKTGAAYVPLDPGFPKDRLHYMAQDADVRLVITDSLNADLSGVPRDKQVRIDDDAAAIAAMPDTAPPAQAHWPADAPAYVIYTSGSTGQPKGVVLPQNAVCNFLASMRREPGLQASDRLLAVTTLSFDIAVLELFLPLTTGARTVLAQREEAMDGEVLGRLVASQGINVMQATPTTWHMLLDANWRAPAGFKALCGGEPLPPSLAERLLQAGVELWNMYGPTETTVWSTLSRIVDAKQKITIGRPIANTQVWVLDEQLKPCAIGQEGELCIGGAGVAIGYFKRPELTLEKFITDPFSRDAGARIYRTGDLARWSDDGTIEHLGRLDFQVKIRGYRIELGEIEARLAALPGIARTVVMAREDDPGDVRLVAYIVTRPGVTADVAQLRDTLRTTLPDYMLPQHIVALDALPLLPNGKIDRKALPAPAEPQPASSVTYHAPRNDLERTIAEAMQTMLKIRQLGVDDDFFAVGGHSLLAARVIGQINKQLGTQLTLRALFEAPTVATLAQAIEGQRSGANTPELQRTPIVHRADQSTAPLTVMQERIRFVEEMQPGRVAYNAPSAHRLTGPMNLQLFDQAFAEMIRRQPALRTAIVPQGGRYIQKVLDHVDASLLPLEDLSELPKPQREAVLAQRLEALTAETFDLSQAPLLKMRLFKLAEQEHALFFMTHHILWDGWSFDIFYTEISSLYEALLHGKAPDLAPLSITYGDYAQWHQEWLKSDELTDQVAYWSRQFGEGAMPKAPWGDVPRQFASAGRGSTQWLHLDDTLVEQVRDVAKQTGSTLSIVMMSVYAALMSQWLGDNRPAIGMPFRGRSTPELDAIMGFFNNMLPIRLEVQPQLTCLDWIKSVRQTMVAAFASQDAPFELLSREMAGQRAGVDNRLYQVMFSFQDVRQRQTHWGPLVHERIPLLQQAATEDLNLWMVEIPGGIEGGFQYNADLFLPSTAEALCNRFVSALTSLVSDPRQAVAQLLAMRPAEQALVERWSTAPSRALDAGDPLQAIAARITATPDRPALRSGPLTITYGELGQRMQAFKAVLASKLTARHALIAVSVDDPLAQIIASLAVLDSGARCLVLDPETAFEALQTLAPALHIDASISDTPAGIDGTVWIDAQEIQDARPARRTTEGHVRLALMALTGSAPTVVDRDSLSALYGALSKDIRLLASDRVLCIDDAARGLHLTQAVLALSQGAALVFADAEIAQDGQQLAALVRGESVAMLHASAAAWTRLLATNPVGASLPLIAWLDVTETTPELVAALLEANATVMSIFRPTASSVPIAAGLLSGAQDSGLFGQPLVPDWVRIVDAQGALVPPGIAGQLRCAAAPGSTSFSTGLQARWRTDGILQCLGPVKGTAFLEGHALDLTALEQRLKAQTGVQDAAVALVDDAQGHRRLHTWVQGRPNASLDQARCSAALRQALPSHIAPPHLMEVARISRLLDGSLDPALLSRKRHAAADTPRHAPSTPTEQALAKVWQELLGITEVGQQDNFFELGGTSLLAMQAVLQLEQRIGKQLSPRRYVIETLAQLAAAYDQIGASPASAKPDPAKRAGFAQRLAALIKRA